MTARLERATDEELAPGTTLGPHVIEALVGSGATGCVYKARREDGRTVALKVIHRHLSGQHQIAARFRREAKLIGQIQGEHLARFYDAFEHEGLLVLALEHVAGESLEQRLAREGKLDPLEATELALQICAGLGAVHAAGIVHRDLKPANVLLERSSSRPGALVKLVDFGLAKAVHGRMSTGLTERDMIFGTAEYMAPEQARGDDVDHRCDLYALGILLFEMLEGRVPFQEKTPIATMTMHLSTPPPSLSEPGVPKGLCSIVAKALEKDPDARFETARDFAMALTGRAAAREGADPATEDTELHLESLVQRAAQIASSSVPPSGGDAASKAPPTDAPGPAVASASSAPPASSEVSSPGSMSSPMASSSKTPSRTTPSEPLEREPVSEGPTATLRRERRWLVRAVVIAALLGIAIGVWAGFR